MIDVEADVDIAGKGSNGAWTSGDTDYTEHKEYNMPSNTINVSNIEVAMQKLTSIDRFHHPL